MGRQAYITRLALGRSPYEAPVLSETGDFILGPYAHEFDNTDTGYAQQFNERGHPEFSASRAAARDLRRAKNDVLSTVGVVYKKAKPTSSKENEGELIKLATAENNTGFFLSSVDNISMFCSLWWLFSLRMRVQAFESHSMPLLQIMKSELQAFGIRGFMFAGLPACLTSAVLSSWRKYWMSDQIKHLLADFRFRTIFEILFFSLYSSIEVFGTLQSLHLIPAQHIMDLSTLIRPISQSTFRLPNTSFEVFASPILLLWAYTSLNSNLHSMLWYIIRGSTLKPDKPDRISRLALEPIEDAEAKVPGLQERPWTLTDEVRFQSSKIKDWFQTYLKHLFVRHETAERESTTIHPGLITSPPPPPPPTHPPTPSSERASTATPDPEDLFVLSEYPNHESSSRIWFDPNAPPEEPQPQPLWRTNTLFTPLNQSPATTPPASPRVHASLIHRDSETVTMQLELVETFRPLEPDDELELRNEISNTSEQAPLAHNPPSSAEAANTNIPASAGANMTEAMISDLARAIRDADLDDQRPLRGANGTSPHTYTHKQQHRVTALTNFPADAFASHAACWLTTAALLPLEAVFVRSLTRAFLRGSGGGGGGGGGGGLPQQQLLSLRPLFSSVGAQGWKSYTATMLALMGMQALVSSAVWVVGTAVAVGMGRAWYAWGRGRATGGQPGSGRGRRRGL